LFWRTPAKESIVHKALAFMTALAAALLLAAAAHAAQAGQGVPTKITSDRMHYSPTGQEVVFEGNVHVNREDMDLRAGTIAIHFAPGGEPAQEGQPLDPGRIEKITASDGVRIERQGKVGTAARATYLVREGLLRLEGDPVLQDGKNTIRGETIKLYLKDNRSEVVGGENQRVEALFFTPEDLQAQ
jgi:lipopolysaccharide export system protein LptA